MLISLVWWITLPNSVVSAMVAFSCFSRQVSLPADQSFMSALWDVLTTPVPSTLTATVQFMFIAHAISKRQQHVKLPCVLLSSGNHMLGHWWLLQRWTPEGVFEALSQMQSWTLRWEYKSYLVDVQATLLFKSAPGPCVVQSVRNTQLAASCQCMRSQSPQLSSLR